MKAPPTLPTNSIQKDKRENGWLHVLTDMETKWSNMGLRRLWWLKRSELSQRLQYLQESTHNDSLFSIQEQDERRVELGEFLGSSFFVRLENNLQSSFWRRLFRHISHSEKSGDLIEQWRQRYQKAGKLKDFETQYDLYRRKLGNILRSKPESLFDNSERAKRLLPQIKSTRRSFLKHQERHLRRHTRFSRIIGSLHDDELDEQLRMLAEDFGLIGRAHEWFEEFEKLVNEVFDHIDNRDYGQNESVIRLLQNDFLLTMQQRFAIYWRYHELRERCFADNRTGLISQISNFEQQRFELRANGKPSRVADELLKGFIKTLETNLATEARSERTRKDKIDRILRVDHTSRLEQWAEFKQTNPFDHKTTINVFNHLRPLLLHCPEWWQEFSIFRSLIKVKRLTNKKRKNSEAELEDARLFVQRMSDRIDRELTTDVSFRLLEQDLIRSEVYLSDLDIARKEITLQRELRNNDSTQKINEIKQAFIRLIWNKRAPEDEQECAIVTPLFARASPVFTHTTSPKKNHDNGTVKFKR